MDEDRNSILYRWKEEKELPLSEDILRRLNRSEASLKIVYLSDSKGKDEDTFSVDPADPESFIQLIDSLQKESFAFRHVLFLWTEQPANGDPGEQLTIGFRSLIHLNQALSAKKVSHPMKLSVVTRNHFQVTGNEMLIFIMARSLVY